MNGTSIRRRRQEVPLRGTENERGKRTLSPAKRVLAASSLCSRAIHGMVGSDMSSACILYLLFAPIRSIISLILIFRGSDTRGFRPDLPVIRKSTFRFKTHP